MSLFLQPGSSGSSPSRRQRCKGEKNSQIKTDGNQQEWVNKKKTVTQKPRRRRRRKSSSASSGGFTTSMSSDSTGSIDSPQSGSELPPFMIMTRNHQMSPPPLTPYRHYTRASPSSSSKSVAATADEYEDFHAGCEYHTIPNPINLPLPPVEWIEDVHVMSLQIKRMLRL